MREIRTSGSEGGGAGNSTGPPYPYKTAPPEGDLKPDSSGAVLSPGIHARAEGVATGFRDTL
jgi:hypothetical protein